MYSEFVVHPNAWQGLQNSKLFQNIKVSAKQEDGVNQTNISLLISGNELPSCKFSPDATFQGDFYNPQFILGVHSYFHFILTDMMRFS